MEKTVTLQFCVYFHEHVGSVEGQRLLSINWVASAVTGFFPFNQTYTEARPSEIDQINRN